MKKTVKVALGVLAGVVMAGTAGAAVWLAVGCGSAEGPATEVRSATLAELADGEVDLAMVREAYEQFEVSPLQGFYGDELLTEIFGDNRERGRLEMALNRAENWTGAAVRAKYQEMFGEEIELTEEKYGEAALAEGARWLWTVKGGGYYDEERDEFRELEGGADISSRYIRRLERAEKAGNKVYLYERALTIRCQPDPRFDEEGNQVGGGSSCGILTVAATCGTPEFGWSGEMEGMTDEEILEEAAERGLGLTRWEFELVNGRLVYRGMERADVGTEDSGDGSEGRAVGGETEDSGAEVDLNKVKEENE